MRVYLVRHGETEWALTGQHTGLSDIPLTERGQEQAKGLTAKLNGVEFTHVFSSPLQRALNTCLLADIQPKVQLEPELVEWNYGDYDGVTSADIKKQRPHWSVYRDGCPNGEMPDEVAARADRLIAKIRTLEGNIALFTHGQFGAVLGMRWVGLPIAEAEHFPLATASLSILGYADHHPDVATLRVWNS